MLHLPSTRVLAAVAALLVFGEAAPALADPDVAEQALAASLFKEGRRLLDEGRIPEACMKFAESERLDPGGGTVLNLAECHRLEGRTASAWTEFTEALAAARRDGRADREAVAQARIAELEPGLARVTIDVSAASAIDGLEVSLDGAPVRRPAWGVTVPVDPGEHVITAKAPGKKPFEGKVKVREPGTIVVVSIAALEDAPSPPVADQVPPAPASATPPVAPREERGSSRLVAAAVLGGVGVVGIGVGTGFGIDAISKHATSNRECPNNQCTQAGVTANDQSKTAADVSTVAFAVALPTLGVAAYLWITGSRSTPTTALQVTPLVSRSGAGMTIGRSF